MGVSLLGSETSLYDFTQQGVGNLIDSIAGANFSVTGTPIRSGAYWEFDGVDDRADAVSNPVNTGQDHSHYLVVSLLGDLDDIVHGLMTSEASRRFSLFWDDTGPNHFNSIVNDANNTGGNSIFAGIALGEEINEPIKIGIGVSYTASTDTFVMAVKLSNGFSGTATFTHNSQQPTNGFIRIGQSPKGFGHSRFYNMGFFTAAKALEDLEATVEELVPTIITGPSEDELRRNLFIRGRRGAA